MKFDLAGVAPLLWRIVLVTAAGSWFNSDPSGPLARRGILASRGTRLFFPPGGRGTASSDRMGLSKGPSRSPPWPARLSWAFRRSRLFWEEAMAENVIVLDDQGKPIVRTCALCRRPSTPENPVRGPGVCDACAGVTHAVPISRWPATRDSLGRFLPGRAAD